MKTVITIVMALISGRIALADITERPIENAEVIVFNAACAPVSVSEGQLTVSLQARSGDLFVKGEFYGYSTTTAAELNDRRIPIEDCQNVQADLSQQAGRTISLKGQYTEQAYKALVNVWGTCQAHRRAGGGSYPCKSGTRYITKYKRMTTLELGAVNIVNLNE